MPRVLQNWALAKITNIPSNLPFFPLKPPGFGAAEIDFGAQVFGGWARRKGPGKKELGLWESKEPCGAGAVWSHWSGGSPETKGVPTGGSGLPLPRCPMGSLDSARSNCIR